MGKPVAENPGTKQSQINSKQRVADHGEVYTREEEVNAMIDLVDHQADQIETRFLEPACGTGNFLAEVLRRKLEVVNRRYPKAQRENYELGVIVATSSVYGIELLADNVLACRERLLEIVFYHFKARYPKGPDQELVANLTFILDLNIVHGDALSFERKDGAEGPIRFSQWSAIGRKMKRWEYAYGYMVNGEEASAPQPSPQSMLPGLAPEPIEEPYLIKEYDAVYFRELHRAY